MAPPCLPETADQGCRAKGLLDRRQSEGASRQKSHAWVKSHAHEIALFFLPSYASDHNPDEFLNGDLKQKLRQKPQAATKDQLVKTTRAIMRAIQRSPERIKTYFMAEPVKYAA